MEWYHALRRLQAAISLGMQLQRPARPDLKARGMGLEGYSLYHAQPRPCQPAVALNDVGRTAICCVFAIKTGEGLTIDSLISLTPYLGFTRPPYTPLTDFQQVYNSTTHTRTYLGADY